MLAVLVPVIGVAAFTLVIPVTLAISASCSSSPSPTERS